MNESSPESEISKQLAAARARKAAPEKTPTRKRSSVISEPTLAEIQANIDAQNEAAEAKREQERQEAQEKAKVEAAKKQKEAREAQERAERERMEMVRINLPPRPLETLETKTYSTEYIKARIKTLLESVDEIKNIKVLDVVGSGNQIKIETRVTVEKFLTVEVAMGAILESEAGVIKVKKHKIKASQFQEKVEEKIVPKLDQVSELLKSYIEKEEKKTVKKMEIANGELVVTFDPSSNKEQDQKKKTQKIEFPPTPPESQEKKPGFFKKHWKSLLLATGLAVGGGYGIQKADGANWGIKDPYAVKSSQPYTPEMKASYMAEAEKVHKEIVEAQARKIANREKANAQFADNLEKLEKREAFPDTMAELSKKLEEAKKAALDIKDATQKAAQKITEKLSAKEKAAKELAEKQQKQLNEIKEKLEKMQEHKTEPLTSIDTKTIETPKNVKEKKLPEEIPASLKREGIKVTSGSADSGGYNVIYHSNPQGLSFNKVAESTQKKTLNSPFGLDPKTLEEKIDIVFQNNIDKWDAEAWSNVQDKKAASFLKQKKFTQGKEEEEKAIQKYVQRVQKISELEPEKKETVHSYVDRVLKYEASKGLEQLHNLQL